MQIQRAKEESMGGVSRESRRINIGESSFAAAANELQRKNKEQRTSVNPSFQRSSTSSVIPPRPITAKSLNLELPTLDVNSSFLHGTFDTTDNNLSSREKSSRKNDNIDNDEVVEDDFVIVGKSIINSDDVKSSVASATVVYATIDSLALKRATLPLRLLPIDVNSDPISNVDDDEQSFKKKHAGLGTTTTQSKCRDVRSSPRNFPSSQSATTTNKLEDIAKGTPSNDVTLFEKVVSKKNDNRLDCEISESAPVYSTIDHCSGIVPLASCELPEIGRVIGNDENSNDDRSLEWSRSRTFERVEKIALENEKNQENREQRRSRSNDESSGNVITVDDCRTNKERVVTLTKKKTMKKFTKLPKKKIFACKRKTVNNGTTADRFKPELTGDKSRDTKNRNCPNSSIKERKYLSRKELRYASISLPTNFVHLSSATSPKLLSPNAESKKKLDATRNAEASPSFQTESTVYLKNGEKSKSDRTIVRVFDGDTTERNDNESRGRFDEKVRFLQLEKSQGVPEVVKISENEDNDRDEFARPSLDKPICDETVSPPSIYEAMSEFSVIHPPISTSSSSSSLSTAGKIITNTSFLWGTTMTGRRKNAASTDSSTMVNDESTTGIMEKGVTTDENGKITEQSIDAANSYDHEAYDDVGNWRVDACTAYREQQDSDHYDDVGLPLTVGSSRSLSSSTGTVFEEISVYDDVLPTTTSRTSLDVTILENGSQSGNKNCATPVFSVNSVQNKYSHRGINGIDENFFKSNETENDDEHHDYLSIGNDYSSLEEEEDVVRFNERGKYKDTDPLLLIYDDIQLPCHDRVNSLYAGSSSAGSLLGSLIYNGKESEWEDLEEVAAVADPVLLSSPMTINNNNNNKSWASQNTDNAPSSSSNKKKIAQRRSRRVKRQKSKVSSRRNPPTGRSLTSCPEAVGTERSVTAPTFSDSDDSNYETLFSSFPSDEFSSGDDDKVNNDNDKEKEDATSRRNGDSGVDITSGIDSIVRLDEAPSRPVPPPPRESSLTGTLGKQMKILRRTWSITKGSLGRMRRRTSNSNIENDSSNNGINDGENRDANREQRQNCSGNDGRNKYLSFKRHFRKSVTGLSTFYLEANECHNVLHNDADDADDDDDDDDKKLSRNNNRTKEAIYGNISDNSNNRYRNTTYRNSGSNDQSRNNSNVDHYSMLDEEPLYQFYVAAAAARVAFESDSEGYEEVEDPMPSPSTVDLARPGHRTLWCQTPQVINSPLLQSLTSDERKVQEAKFEILTSEASYLNSLRVLVDQFLNNHDLMHEVLSPAEREKLFGGVPSVLGASERLLAELETVWREDPMLQGLPELLLNYAQRSSSVYVAYCSNQVSIDTTLKELRSRKGSKFVDTLTRIEAHTTCQSLSLHSFLMLPMQRVTRLPLLADAVLSRLSTDKKEERTRWEVVLSQFSRVVVECNEGARAAGRLAEMEQLNRKLEYSPKVPPILLRGRHLIRRGPVVRLMAKSEVDYKLTFGRKYHKASLYLLLLSDHLLIARPKSITTNEETYTVIDTCKRSLVALEKITEPESPFAGRNAMILTLLENYSGRHVEYILTCDNATERERWIDAISPPKPSLVGETLYETWDCPQVMALYLYAAAQPDELTLQPGDVINVLRKMTDGWYLGEKLLGGEQGWFPGNYAKEVSSEHVRARNLRQRHRLLALSASVLQQRAKQMSR